MERLYYITIKFTAKIVGCSNERLKKYRNKVSRDDAQYDPVSSFWHPMNPAALDASKKQVE